MNNKHAHKYAQISQIMKETKKTNENQSITSKQKIQKKTNRKYKKVCKPELV